MQIKPREGMTALDVAFPTKIDGYLPPYATIPDEFKDWNNEWSLLASRWFYRGMKGAKFTAKAGIDKNAALCHLQYCLGSFEPQHEHKIAGVAYLMSQWFKKIKVQKEASDA